MSCVPYMTGEEIKSKALEVGFDACGIAGVEPLGDDMRRWKEWVEAGMNAGMGYMEKRLEVRELMEGARSVIVCLMNYYPGETEYFSLGETEHAPSVQQHISTRGIMPKIAKYAWGRDYHYIMWGKLRQLAEELRLERFVATCDTMPLMERALAVRAGLGWIGRNNMLVNPRFGSFTFIGTLITEMELRADEPMENSCGKCFRCVESCPTGALCEHCLDARKCLSYRTIESKEVLTEEEARHGWAFGCDACQDVCPWNKRFAHCSEHEEFKALNIDILSATNSQLKGSALSRANLSKLKENYKKARRLSIKRV